MENATQITITSEIVKHGETPKNCWKTLLYKLEFVDLIKISVLWLIAFSGLVISLIWLLISLQKLPPLKESQESGVIIGSRNYIDESVDPCQDFFKFACGGYERIFSQALQNSSIREYWIFNFLQNLKEDSYKRLLDGINSTNSSSAEWKAATFYKSCIKKQTFGIDKYPLELGLEENYEGNLSKSSIDFGAVPGNCEQITSNYFPDILIELMKAEENEQEREAIVEIILQIEETFRETIKTFPWVDDAIISRLFENTETLLGYVENAPTEKSELDAIYQNLTLYENSYSYNKHCLEMEFNEDDVIRTWYEKLNLYTPWTLFPYIFEDDEKCGVILIPFAFVKPPIFQLDYPNVFKYARFGTTIGHEWTHLLQGQVEMSDIPYTSGNNNSSSFQSTIDCVVDQFDGIIVSNVSGKELKVNGSFTMKENMADILGYQTAFKAFMKYGNYFPIPSFSSYSKEQVFFIAAAQTFCTAYQNEEARAQSLDDQLKNDSHSPYILRAFGLANLDEFSDAFNCPLGSVYNPEKKCRF